MACQKKVEPTSISMVAAPLHVVAPGPEMLDISTTIPISQWPEFKRFVDTQLEIYSKREIR